jgi:hypothetical protein
MAGLLKKHYLTVQMNMEKFIWTTIEKFARKKFSDGKIDILNY